MRIPRPLAPGPASRIGPPNSAARVSSGRAKRASTASRGSNSKVNGMCGSSSSQDSVRPTRPDAGLEDQLVRAVGLEVGGDQLELGPARPGDPRAERFQARPTRPGDPVRPFQVRRAGRPPFVAEERDAVTRPRSGSATSARAGSARRAFQWT